MQRQCSATKANGERCGAPPYQHGPFCWFHDPAQADKRADGRRQGGAAKSNQRRARKGLETHAMTPRELEGIIGLTITQVLAEQKTPGVANAVAALARAAVTIREASEIEKRLAALEAASGIADTKWKA